MSFVLPVLLAACSVDRSPTATNPGRAAPWPVGEDADADGFADARVAAALGGPDLASTTLTGTGSATDPLIGLTVATADVNGDGYDDVVAGASGYGGYLDLYDLRGVVYVYEGSAAGLSTSARRISRSSGDGEFGARVARAGDLDGDGFEDVLVIVEGDDTVVDEVQVFHGSADGLEETPRVTIVTASAAASLSGTATAAGDVDGDGYDDVVLSDYADARAAWVYRGSASGLSTTPAVTLSAPDDAPDYFGSFLAAGDFDADGYSDVVVGSAYHGRTYIHAGSAAGTSVTPTTTLTTFATTEYATSPTASVGDADGDGYDDLLVGVSMTEVGLFRGSPSGLSSAASATLAGDPLSVTGYSRFVGDTQGDGYDDLLVCSGTYGGSKLFALHLGTASGVSTTGSAEIFEPGSYARTSLFGHGSASGDFDGDGLSDLVMGSRTTGGVYVYEGAAAGVSDTPTATLSADEVTRFGEDVAILGDVNGDGIDDVGVAVPGLAEVHVHHGSATGIDDEPALTLTGTYGWGESFAAAGDVNGDGYDDVLVGIQGGAGSTQRVSLFPGSAAGLDTAAAVSYDVRLVSGTPFDGLGDVDGDGYDDVAIGHAADDDDRGRVDVYHGSAAGLPGTPSTTLTGPDAAGGYGGAVAGAGDVNGDGYADVVIGADDLASGKGAAYVHHGGPAGVEPTPAMTVLGVASAGRLGGFVAGAGDVNDDGYDDVLVSETNRYTVYLFLGSAGGVSSTAASTWVGTGGTTAGFGEVAVGIGDTDGDGYADVAIGEPRSTYSGGPGTVWIYQGGSDGPAAEPSANLSGSTLSRFGVSVAGRGDVNGDGVVDLVVGAPDAGPSGAVYVYQGAGDADGDTGDTDTGDTDTGDTGTVDTGATDTADTGTSDTADTADTEASDTGAPDEDALGPGDGACGCAARGPSPLGLWGAALVACVWRRRRAATLGR